LVKEKRKTKEKIAKHLKVWWLISLPKNLENLIHVGGNAPGRDTVEPDTRADRDTRDVV
jgi:hypothetical protein